MDVAIDEEAGRMREQPAVVIVHNAGRKRFAANCVAVADSEEAAKCRARPAHHERAALVIGPSRSSESLDMYYLVRWLD